MLLLSRNARESIRIDNVIEITVLEVRGKRVKLGIEAPPHVRIARSEIQAPVEEEELSLRSV